MCATLDISLKLLKWPSPDLVYDSKTVATFAYEGNSTGVTHLQPCQDAGFLRVGGVAPGAGDTAEAFGLGEESFSRAHNPAHLTHSWRRGRQTVNSGGFTSPARTKLKPTMLQHQ